MSYVYDGTTDRSDVVILDAQDFTGDPVATIHLPPGVPFGFHGNWFPTPPDRSALGPRTSVSRTPPRSGVVRDESPEGLSGSGLADHPDLFRGPLAGPLVRGEPGIGRRRAPGAAAAR